MDKNQAEIEMIIKAQQGDLNSENELLMMYTHLVKSISRANKIIGIDRDDLDQVGMIGLMNAVRTFKTDTNASFKTYASCCIQNSINDAVRKHNSDSKHTVGLSDTHDEIQDPTDKQDPEKIYIESETARLLTKAISSVLNERERQVLPLYLGALSYSEISQKLNMEKKTVDNTIYSLKKKIKKLLNGNHSL